MAGAYTVARIEIAVLMACSVRVLGCHQWRNVLHVTALACQALLHAAPRPNNPTLRWCQQQPTHTGDVTQGCASALAS